MSIENRMAEMVETHVRKVKQHARTNLAQQVWCYSGPSIVYGEDEENTMKVKDETH